MKPSVFAGLFLLLSACVQDTVPGGPVVEPPEGSLELTSLATEGGAQQLTFFNGAVDIGQGSTTVLLQIAADALGLPHVVVHASKVEAVQARAKVVSARAVASIPALVEAARHVASRDTIWLLPRGRVSADDLAGTDQLARVFHVEQRWLGVGLARMARLAVRSFVARVCVVRGFGVVTCSCTENYKPN